VDAWAAIFSIQRETFKNLYLIFQLTNSTLITFVFTQDLCEIWLYKICKLFLSFSTLFYYVVVVHCERFQISVRVPLASLPLAFPDAGSGDQNDDK